MLHVSQTTDKLQIVCSVAANVDVHASFSDLNTSTGAVVPDKQNTNIQVNTAVDVVASPAANNVRRVHLLTIRNKHATVATSVTVIFNQNGTSFELPFSFNLDPGEGVMFVEGSPVYLIEPSVAAIPPNVSTADQAVGASVTNYITNSNLQIPLTRPLKVGTIIRHVIALTKTAAGTAAATFDLRVGTTGTTADTSRGSFSTGTQTAAIDTAIVRMTTVIRGPITATGVVQVNFDMAHNLASTGFGPTANVINQATSGTFDLTTGNLIFGVSVTTGASHAYTIQQVTAEITNI